MAETSLAIFTRAAVMLAEADTIQKVKELKDLALTAEDWARRKGMGLEAERHCHEYAMRAMHRMGEMLAQTDRAKGTRGQLTGDVPVGGNVVSPPTPDTTPTLAALGITKRESSEAQRLAAMPAATVESVVTGRLSLAKAIQHTRKAEVMVDLAAVETRDPKPATGVYDVLVIDPPWPMEKIERDCRPNQVEFDYPTMTEAELAALRLPYADACHVWVWTTHRFLPMAFRLLDHWGLRYVCCFVWHKPGGFQPVGLPQYNCEFALYARRGSPVFVETAAFPVCFAADRHGHSVKPEEFYATVRRVTSGRRLDMFNRRPIEGFDTWGQEAGA